MNPPNASSADKVAVKRLALGSCRVSDVVKDAVAPSRDRNIVQIVVL